jgi:hypothetical protein
MFLIGLRFEKEEERIEKEEPHYEEETSRIPLYMISSSMVASPVAGAAAGAAAPLVLAAGATALGSKYSLISASSSSTVLGLGRPAARPLRPPRPAALAPAPPAAALTGLGAAAALGLLFSFFPLGAL